MKIKQLRPSGCTSAVRKLLAVLLFMATAHAMQAADVMGDTLEVRFRVGQSNLDLSYADNEQRINEFVAKVKARCAKTPDLNLKMDVYGGASPEGPNELNRRLGEQRGLSLKEVLASRLEGCLDQITVVNQGARWGALYNMVQASNEPWKYEVLDVLMKPDTEEDGFQRDPRETKLRKMKNGSIWKTLQAKYLPPLRSSGSAVILPMTQEEVARCCDTLVIRDTIIYLPEPCPRYEEPIDSSWVWAIKTNFILWGLAAPNGQVEFPLGRSNRWSIEGEVFWPWWIWSHSSHAHQCGNVGLELKYWLGDRKKHHTIDGWHLGLGVAAGYYDFEWTQHKGYQGEYLNIYGNLGYQHRFGKRKQWAIDAGLAIGWIPTKYREYLGSSIFPEGFEEEYDDHLMWQRSSSKHIFGLTHANITLAYLIHSKSKKNQQVEDYEPVAPVAATYTTTRPTALETAPAGTPAPNNIVSSTKEEERSAKEAAKLAEKQAKADAEAAEKAAKAEAKAAAEREKAAAKAAKEQADADARAAKQQAEADAKAAKAQAEADARAAKAEAEAAAAREKAAAKAAKQQAEAEAKAAKAAAKQAESTAVGYAATVTEPASKADTKAEKAAAKQAAAEAKAAQARAKAEAKEAEARAKAEAKLAAKRAKEEAKAGNVTAAQEAIAAQARAKAEAKAQQATAEEQAIAAQARAKAEAKAAEKKAKEEAKAAAKAEKEARKAAKN